MVRPIPLAFAAFIAISFCLSSCADELTAQRFQKKITTELDLPFLLSLPKGYEANSEKKWPLVVFLHGAGERGNNLELLKKHGPPRRVVDGANFPFILVSPQCPAEEWWTEQPVLELVDHIESTYQVDSSRIYLTGLSMGGYGTWHFSTLAPKRFAAVAPVCGGGVPYKMRWIPHLPVWAFHGAKDTVVPLSETTSLVDALKKHGNKEVKLSVYPEANHDSWSETFANPKLYDWLLSFSLPEKK